MGTFQFFYIQIEFFDCFVNKNPSQPLHYRSGQIEVGQSLTVLKE